MVQKSLRCEIMLKLLFLITLSGFHSFSLNAQSFQGLGDLPEGYVGSYAKAVSADGQIVVGQSSSSIGPEAYRWTQEGGMVGLGMFPSPVGRSSHAYGLSANGDVVVGYSLLNNHHNEGFRWTQTASLVGLGYFSGGTIIESYAFGTSADGSVVVGYSRSANGREAFRWTEAGGMVGLGDLPQNDFRSEASGVSADGTVVVGWSYSGSGPEAFRWTQATGMVGLGAPSQDQFESRALAISGNGAVIVGYAYYPGEVYQAFRWTQAGGMVPLEDLPGGIVNSRALAVSGDGSVVVGYGTTDAGQEAFIWHTSIGMRRLRDHIAGYGLWAYDWVLLEATGVSADGLTIVGNGKYTQFGSTHDEGWIVNLAISTGIDDARTGIPLTPFLSQNFPNPFNPNTKINYSIPQNSFVTLKVYNILGNEIATLVNEEKAVGNYEIEFNGGNLSSGVYFYKMRTGSFIDTKKFILIK